MSSKRHASRGEDRRNRELSRYRSELPPRPRLGKRDSDDEIDAADYDEFRRLKRLKLAEQQRYLIWGRSPSPSPEPEALPQANAASAQPSAAPRAVATPVPVEEREAVANDQAALFVKWAAEKKERAAVEAEERRKEAEANTLVGPSLPSSMETGAAGGADYGINMRPGEGERMAAYVNSGKRIPRRGEVGMTSEQISHYESVGYVMSGSRHSRMNAIRIRKENQVYTAEEKAALAMYNAEEARKKEDKLMAEMQALVQQTIGDSAGAGGDDAH